MHKPSKNRVILVGVVLGCLVIVGLLFGLAFRSKNAQSFFRPAPAGVTLQFLGGASNYLKFDGEHSWKAFSVSNGTSRTLFYAVTEIEYRTADGWRSAGSLFANTLTNSSLTTHRETAGEISPGTADVFYATIATSSIPWRLRLGCFESGWSDKMDSFTAKFRGLPPSKTKSWSGRRYELISSEITP